ncbi:FKBP-type peptidyl-prolyl cis-trans isomerase [Candidatus Berkiella aquae]|uniref:Peptidyl-prolyl cis-trans isomerase n=1 Tax=Candidatus Berkiella aquae TaxID=295108 RepID=A0A0A7UXA0_9GAMM|nr:FKBP-type peptidyl-prolyl cis-trans isomerase [Candidatus Berkiella aquae]AJA90913.1 macrophage infectivity potentiator [Candidatus Berkiella aquae]MCS5710904.1 FKBP-type peptidyl-prolyl cis-trans isomerase [Candidatus Berkiella aquae]
MKRTLIALTTATLCFFAQQSFAAEGKAMQLKDKTDKISYSIGVDVGKSIQKQKIEINPEAFLAGFKEGQADKLTLMTEDQIRETLMALQTEMLEKHKALAKELASKNLAEGEKFLTENKKQKGVVTLPSGLQYRIIKEGKGSSPKATDTVVTHYRGKLINGTEFDSSYSRGEPAKFAVNGVIPGWVEALQLMKPGAKWELFVPAKLAYGENGVGQLIGPNSTLLFEVELVNVEGADNTASAPTTKTEKN